MANGRIRQKRRKRRLFYEQDKKCYYCDREMVYYKPKPQMKQPPPDNFATLEHLDDRYSPLRGIFREMGVPRTVVACYRCNFERGKERTRQMTKQELRKRSVHSKDTNGGT